MFRPHDARPAHRLGTAGLAAATVYAFALAAYRRAMAVCEGLRLDALDAPHEDAIVAAEVRRCRHRPLLPRMQRVLIG
ncbi:hypothetical protein [Streptomyces sp. NPDC001389]|uniref:hypothetical protein n=1 Tax=Streptomyces sp. NPDC001389 TaxID=3364569 RepID=UPI00369A8FA7